MQTPKATTAETTKSVWDPLIRLCHWAIGLCFAITYWLGSDWLGLHAQLGYTIALLVIFRVLWGFVGTQYARFSEFVPGPTELRSYFGTMHKRTLGHDPLGALMIIALLVALFLTALSGMTLWAMEGRGPLASTFVVHWPGALVEDLHHFASDATLALVILHVAGVLIMGRLHKQRLIRAMIDGRKRA